MVSLFKHLARRASRRTRGRIIAVKWGLNPNSSSLGVDVTFLLFGAAVLSLTTPLVSALIRWRKPATPSGTGSASTGTASTAHESAPQEPPASRSQ